MDNHFNTPAEVIDLSIKTCENKTRLPLGKMILLGIMAVHPMRREGIEAVLAQSGADWTRVEALLARGELIESPFEGRTYYVRRFAREG